MIVLFILLVILVIFILLMLGLLCRVCDHDEQLTELHLDVMKLKVAMYEKED